MNDDDIKIPPYYLTVEVTRAEAEELSGWLQRIAGFPYVYPAVKPVLSRLTDAANLILEAQ